MADFIEERRIEKGLSTDQPITEPTSNDHTDGTWAVTDTYERELVVTGDTLLNAKIQFRIGSDIVKILSLEGVQALISQSGSGIQDPTSDGTFARLKAGANTSWQQLANNISSFSDTHIDRLIALVFSELTRSGSAVPSSFEKGVATVINYSYNVVLNDDTITQLIWDGQIFNSNFPLSSVASDPAAENTSSRTLEISKATGTTPNLTVTSSAIIPQWRGVSGLADFSGAYAELEAELNKVIQSSNNQTATFAMTGSYAFFVSTDANAGIKDANGFPQTIGVWGDGSSEFYKKSITVTLANGSTENLTIYRTRQQKVATLTYSLT